MKPKNKIKLPLLSKLSIGILKIGLPLIALLFFYILFQLIFTPENAKAWVLYCINDRLEYVFMSFTLIVCGALFVDMAVKSYKK